MDCVEKDGRPNSMDRLELSQLESKYPGQKGTRIPVSGKCISLIRGDISLFR